MKSLISLIVLVLLLAGTAYAYCQTDYQCMNNCTAKGYQWGYCKSMCSWCTEW